MSDDVNGQATGQPTEGSAATAVATPPAPPAPPVPPAPAGTAWGPGPGNHGRDRGYRSGGAVFGVLLVVIGLVALAGGFTSVFDVFRLWPLLVIFGGIMQMVHPHGDAVVKRIAEGLGSIAVGLVLLGNTFGIIPWTVWITVISLWPLLLVALGIELVGRGLHMTWLRALSNVLLILGLAYAVLVLQPSAGRVAFPFSFTSAGTQTFSDARQHDAAVTSGSATVKVGATRLTLAAGDKLATLDGQGPIGEKPMLAASVTGGAVDVQVSEPGDHVFFVGTQDRSIDITLDRAVRWREVRFDVGAVAADADLSGLDVSNVLLNTGASDARLKIGSRADAVAVDVSGGATSITVLVPANAACNIEASSGLSNVRVPAGFRQTSGIVGIGRSTYVAAGSGGPKITITLNSGVSDLRIETY